MSHLSREVFSRAGKAISHSPSSPFLFEEGNPLFSIFETVRFFFPVRFSSSAYSSDATFRAAIPVVRPRCSIWQRADHMSVSVARLVTWVWKVRILSIGFPRRNTPWSNCFGNHGSSGPFGRSHL